jgi:hypothetical protein
LTGRSQSHRRARACHLGHHFGAWTGEDILSQPDTLGLLEPHLDVDEVIFLGDMFDFMFSSLQDAFAASEGLLELIRGRLQGKRFVFLAGNHDHHLVRREAEELLGLQLATGKTAAELQEELWRSDYFRRVLGARLAGVEVDIRYPTYTFADVLCTHGHYLDFHARRSGPGPAASWPGRCGRSPLEALSTRRRWRTTRRRSPC